MRLAERLLPFIRFASHDAPNLIICADDEHYFVFSGLVNRASFEHLSIFCWKADFDFAIVEIALR
tara:strand:+ start:274 stop:468 length:195 start_codon:yes stop_codon:yes gene_type:complete